MIVESALPSGTVIFHDKIVKCYNDMGSNVDAATVQSFGEEWKAFHDFDEAELNKIGDDYFDVISPLMTGQDKIAADFGCGSGRWARYISPRFKAVAAIDPSDAIYSAAALLHDIDNVQLYKASIDKLPFPDNYFDFGFSLGVLHHIPDTRKALADCVSKVKPGGHFLVYLYYSLDNRSRLYKALFQVSDLIRRVVSKLPAGLKRFVCSCLAVLLYMPFVLLCRLLKVAGMPRSARKKIPLQFYEDTSFYIIRNDALDRFGTPLEQRFSKAQIHEMMVWAGLTDITFSGRFPYWHCVGKKHNDGA